MAIGYPSMSRALRARGWVQVKGHTRKTQIAGYISKSMKEQYQDESKAFQMMRVDDGELDLKFTLGSQDIGSHNLKKNCFINHNKGEGNLTCKQGLTDNLQKGFQFVGNWYPMEHSDPNGLGIDSFFPRTHVITGSESL